MRDRQGCTLVRKILVALLLSLFGWFPVQAQRLEEKVVEHTLKNGMKFLFVERHEAPVFTGQITFRVGSVDEPIGATGLAHLLEHMAFKGTRTIGTRDYAKEKPILESLDRVAKALAVERSRGEAADAKKIASLQKQMEALHQQHRRLSLGEEFSDIYQRNGAVDLNAGTSKDATTYYVSLPSNRLELWALMESQRMADPVMREFYIERDVVAEERRQSYEDDPAGKLYEQLIATAFVAHPYQWPTIGWMSDILSLNAEQARTFHRRYYVPCNAVAALVGDIHIPEAKRLVEKYFGPIPAGEVPPPLPTVEPPQEGEKRVEVLFDAEPRLLIGYHKPAPPHRDDYVFDILSALLSQGRTSRLYTALVKEKRLALEVDTSMGPGTRYPHLFILSATPLAPHSTTEVEAALYEELERLKKEPVSTRELQKVKNQIEAEQVRSLSSNSGLAGILTYFQTVVGDWRYFARYRDEIEKITPEDVQRVARQYLVPANRTVAILVKKEAKP